MTNGMKTFGPIEDNVRAQIARCAAAEADAPAVLCADNHLGYSMPIGGVIGYRGLVSPSAVGYDIACGNMAVRTDALAREVNIAAVMDDIWRIVSFGMGRKNDERVDAPVLEAIRDSPCTFQRSLLGTAAAQLGTVGSGNHYVDLFEDDADGALWVGVHFGSRGFGHKTATWALEQAGTRNDSMDAPPVVIPIESPLGQDYLAGMLIAGHYAYAGRAWVVGRVLRILGARATDTIHNHHNFAWRELHGGVAYWVHRKGATPAFPGQRGFVGGTMGEPAVILEGVEAPESAAALYSTVHGAGRAMSRTQAAGKTKRSKAWVCGNRACDFTAPARDFSRGKEGALPLCPLDGGKLRLHHSEEQVRPGLVDWPAAQARLALSGIELRGAGADEAPECYKRLDEVLAYHGDTIRILYTLRPIGVAMAGRDEYDPYKD